MTLLFTACGGGGSSEQTDVLGASDTQIVETTRANEKVMKVGEKNSVEKGETIRKVSDDAKITIETNTETGETTATLLEGEAKIVKGRTTFF